MWIFEWCSVHQIDIFIMLVTKAVRQKMSLRCFQSEEQERHVALVILKESGDNPFEQVSATNRLPSKINRPAACLQFVVTIAYDRCCVLFFAASVHAFLFASVRAFPSCPQRLGCHSDQNARWLNHDACCFKLLGKPHSANSYFYLKATFSLMLIIVSWRWVLVIFVICAVNFEASAFACSWARRFGFVLFVAVGSARLFHCSCDVRRIAA